MRGSTVYQVQQIYQTLNKIGSSKHVAKAEARAEGAATWHQIGKELDIYSFPRPMLTEMYGDLVSILQKTQQP